VAEQLAAHPHTPKVDLSNEENGARLFCKLGKLLQGDEPALLGKITFWFPIGKEPKTFGVKYSILAAELPQRDGKEIVFKVSTTK
jgi:hypothetical protein